MATQMTDTEKIISQLRDHSKILKAKVWAASAAGVATCLGILVSLLVLEHLSTVGAVSLVALDVFVFGVAVLRHSQAKREVRPLALDHKEGLRMLKSGRLSTEEKLALAPELAKADIALSMAYTTLGL